MNIATAACPFWGVDIGGYGGVQPSGVVYRRWVQWGTFNPLMRSHGITPREPWHYSVETVALYKRYVWLRENLLEYIYSLAIEAHRTGMPLMRPLPLAFPQEVIVQDCDDEYLFGADLLVAPVHQEGESRHLVLPGGRWTHFWTGEVIDGPVKGEIAAPMNEIPLFFRTGAIVPVQLNHQLVWGESMTNDMVSTLVVTPPTVSTTSRCWSSEAEYATFSLQPEADGFTLQRDGRGDTRYLLIVGLWHDVAEVTVNGEVLCQYDEFPISPGWHRNDDGRVVVCLPHAISQALRVRYVEDES